MTVGRYPNGSDDVYVMNIPTIKKSNIYTTYLEVASQDNPEPSGISNVLINSNNGLKIYYAHDAIIVQSEDTEWADLAIYTMSGQEVASTRLHLNGGKGTFNLSALPSGIYIAKARDMEGNVCATKFKW